VSDPPPPAPVDLTALPPEARDAAWVKHYYRGDEPQLTLRAVVTGGLLGTLMSVSNLYTTLKLGWSFGVAITACVLSHALWRLFGALRLTRRGMTLLENNCMQSTASAAGYSTGGTLATAIGALLLMGTDQDRLRWPAVGAWVFLVALLGVLLAIPMKRQMINVEQLPFPSGIAAAETLRSLYARGHESVLKARALLASLGGGALVGLLRALGVIVQEVPLGFRLFTVKGMIWSRVRPASAARYVVPIASGVVAGESLAAALYAMASNLGWAR
jgi:uncharacterized oligopeptide transporter (OPT) family protein